MTSWVYLNEEGVRAWGDVFPDGRVPVRSVVPFPATLENVKPGEEVQRVYLLGQVPHETLDRILGKLSAKFGAPRDVIRADVERNGLPIRESLTSGSSTDDLGLFLPDFDESEDGGGEDLEDGEEDHP